MTAVSCKLRDRMVCVDGVLVFDSNVQVVAIKSGFISRGFRSILDDQNEALNELRALQTEQFSIQKQGVYAGQGFGPKRTLLNSFVHVQERSSTIEEAGALKNLLSSRCLNSGENVSQDLAFARYAE